MPAFHRPPPEFFFYFLLMAAFWLTLSFGVYFAITAYQKRREWEDAPWVGAIRKIVEAESADPPAALPVQIMPHLLLGDKECASKVEALTAKGVTHVLNCAGRDGRDVATYKKYREVGIETESIDEAEDTEGYPLLYAHQLTASKFIEQAKRSGGVCLIHCMAGINRSGALAIAELMTHERISVVDAVREVKQARGVVLQNQSFQCQLVQMARREGLLGDRPEAEPAAEAKKTK